MQITNNESRMQWVDAMRGFSMLIVVLGHVLLQMGIGGYDSFLSSVLLTFRMPLFFFVSGFFSYRAIKWWNRHKLLDILKRKFQAQILCTVIFCIIFQYAMTNGGSISFEHGFGGYWFTIVLFQMYIIYLLLSLISKGISRDIVIPSLIIISIAFIGILVIYDRSSQIWEFLCWENLTKYMQFFSAGIICSKYRDRFFKLLENNTFITITIIGWIICMILWYNGGFQNKFSILYSFVHDIIVRYFALFSVVICFFSKRNFFADASAYSKCLKFIGRRTLDIYMIHYFLLPNLSYLKDYLNTGNTLIIQILIGGGLTVAIVAVCLLISAILRKSATLEAWLFGVKPKPQTKPIL